MNGDTTVLVTGAGGIIGRAVVASLRGQGVAVIPTVTGATAGLYTDAMIMDLTRPEWDRLPAPPDVIIHLAAALPHDCRYKEDRISGELTRTIDRSVLDLADRTGAYVAYAGSCSIYDPLAPEDKVEDTAPTQATSAYQAAKLAGEMAFRSRGCVFRVSAPYGPGMFSTTVLPRFITLARQGNTIELWGRGDREQDFIHAEDIARFVAAVVERRPAGVFNVAQGRPVTMAELAQMVVSAVGSGTVCFNGRPDPQEGYTARYCIGKAGRLLAWQPDITLPDGLRACRDFTFRR